MWADMMMARGGRLFDGSEMAAILHGEGLPPGTIEALLASTPPPPTCYGGQRPMMSFDAGGARGSTTPDRPLLPPRRSYTPPMLMMNNDSDLDEYSGFFQEHAHSNQSDSKKRRLSPDQVLFLERSFEADNKLEPERKAELARSLGLQPRQVAIWFQNRRARWKTKQLERDFEAVREGYEGLKREFDAARKEKEKLEAEVNYLREQLLNRQKRRRSSVDTSDEIQLQCPASITHQERKTKASFSAEEPAPPQQEQMFTIQQEEPAETDHSGLSHVAEEEDFDDVVAAAAAATTCRYDFPTGVVDDHHPLWLWQPAEFCGP